MQMAYRRRENIVVDLYVRAEPRPLAQTKIKLAKTLLVNI